MKTELIFNTKKLAIVKKAFLLLSAVAALTTSAEAQYRCGTDEVNNKIREQYPEATAYYDAQLRAEMEAMVMKMDWSTFAKTTNINDNEMLHVPIVFHVVHDYGDENLSDNDIYKALNDINLCFRRANSDSNVIVTYAGNIPGTKVKYRGNPNIQFHLAQIDPDGKPTKGITRRRSYLTYAAGDQAKAGQWPPQSYMNVWLIKTFDVNHSGAGAYALLPGSANSNPTSVYYDGVICLAQQTIWDHTLAHELGHTMNLQHPWGAANNLGGANTTCGDDGIDDTPPTTGHFNTGCSNTALYDTACAVGYEKIYSGPLAKNLFNVGDSVNNVIIDYPDTTNAENIMDYTGCAKMFTYLQGVAMRTALRSNVANRNNLMSGANLLSTGVTDANGNIKSLQDLPPVADFSTNSIGTSGPSEQNVFACVGQNISFTNRSWNDTVTGVNWSFTDAGGVNKTATSPTSTLQNFANPGWVSVTLTATSNAGTGTITRDSAVYIAKTTGTNARGYLQSFDNDPDLNEYPIFNHYGNENKWTRVTNVGYWDNASMCMNAYDSRTSKGVPAVMYNTPIGDLDEFYTPPFDLTGYAGSEYCNLNFMLSAACATSNISAMNDELEISYKSCNATTSIWKVLKSLKKGDLVTAGIDTTEFVPKTASDWKMCSYLIPPSDRTANVVFRFRYKCSGKVDDVTTGYRATGNNVYIDRLSFNDFPTDVDGVAYEKNGFALAPNPTTGSSFVVIKGSNTPNKATVQVTDMTGKVVYSTEANIVGETRVEIPANYISVKGIYMVSVIGNNQKHTDKLVVY